VAQVPAVTGPASNSKLASRSGSSTPTSSPTSQSRMPTAATSWRWSGWTPRWQWNWIESEAAAGEWGRRASRRRGLRHLTCAEEGVQVL